MNLLPTPPRTTHKDKENRPPTPVTPPSSKPRVLHIAWSQENLHHAYSTEIRPLPASSSIKAPNKTILKKVKIPLMDQSSPDQPSRYITPEPRDPLQSTSYLKSPLSTLLASYNPSDNSSITLIDLTEAYSELLRRLRSRGPALLDIYGPIPALCPLRDNSEQLARIFRRDIERALIDPQTNLNPNELATSESQPWSSPSSIDSTKKRGFTEQEVKYARDLCNLCHTALRCFSTFAVIPALYSIFSDEQLADILTGILAIPLSPSLPTPNARKTCQLAIWALQVQRLPSVILAPAADRITYAIRRGIDGELGREGKNGAASDGFKAIVMLAEHKPEIFLGPFAELLPSILATLVSTNPVLRVEAANALLGLASSLSMYPNPPPPLLASFSLAIGTYLSDQHQARAPGQELSPIGKIFRTCLNAETPTHAAHSPMWALSCVAAFTVLSRGDALSQPRTIKFILTHLQTAMAAKRTTVRATAGLVWRALIWSCLHLDRQEGETGEKKTSAWKVVRQLIDGAIGISVVAALVGHQDIKSKRLGQAIEVISTMIKKGGKTCEEAVDVLERLLHEVGQMAPSVHRWDENTLLSQPIFDGTLLRSDWKALSGHVKNGLQRSAVIQDIVPLNEEEVAKHWGDLFGLWKEAIAKAPLEENGEVPLPLLNSWTALLSAQVQNHKDLDNLTASFSLSEEITQLLVSFLTDASLDWSLGPTAPIWSSQVLKIGFVRNLWLCVRKVFPISALHTAASRLSNEIITGKFSLKQSAVLEAWSQLHIELALCMSAEQLRTIWHGRICDRQDILLLDIWRTLSRSWLSNAAHFSSTVEVLCAPLDFPTDIHLTRDDLNIWSDLIKHAIESASVYRIEPQVILETIASRVGCSQHTMAICATLPSLLALLSTASFHDASTLPQSLLKLANDVMTATYPPSDCETKAIVFSILRSLRRIVGNVPLSQTLEMLSLIQEGAAAWIGDKSEELSENEFNEEVIPFYGECLKSLARIPPSMDALSKLSPLMVSAFNHIPKPALGPSLFKAYWSKTYQQYPSDILYPESLKHILRSVQEIMCEPEETLAPGISQATGTQSQEWMLDSDMIVDETGPGLESSSNNNEEIPPMANVPQIETFSGLPVTTENQESVINTGVAPLVKQESAELHLPNVPGHSNHRKRRKSISMSLKKKRKTESPTKHTIEIINVSDDDDGESIIEDSIVIVRTPLPSKRTNPLQGGNEGGFNKDRASGKRRKLTTETELQTGSRIKKASPNVFQSSPKDDTSQDSDSSMHGSHLIGPSNPFLLSPRIRHSRSEPLDHPSDDIMSSSPLKSAIARRQLRRSYTAPVNTQPDKESSEDNSSSLYRSSRSKSEGFIALEQAHDAITKGDREMGVEELLRASKMLNGISVALNDQILKKLSSSQTADN